METAIGFNMTCLYKNGEAKNFTLEELKKAVAEGWKDNPTDGAKKEEKSIGASSSGAVKTDSNR